MEDVFNSSFGSPLEELERFKEESMKWKNVQFRSYPTMTFFVCLLYERERQEGEGISVCS